MRMSIVKLSGGGLFILNPIAATRELLDMVHGLEKQHGPVKHVVLSTVAIEHKTYCGCVDIKVQLVLQFGVSRGLREVLLAPVGRVYLSEIVSEFGPLRGPRRRDSETRIILRIT